MNTKTIDLGPVLRNAIQPPLDTAHIVAGSPILHERFHLCQRHSFGPVADSLLVRKARCCKSYLKIFERGGWNGDLKWCHGFRRGWKHNIRRFRLCFSYRSQAGSKAERP